MAFNSSLWEAVAGGSPSQVTWNVKEQPGLHSETLSQMMMMMIVMTGDDNRKTSTLYPLLFPSISAFHR